jgi:HK97 family phage prohead protease
MKIMNNEIRTREISFNFNEEGHISGKAIVFNEISNVLYDAENKRYFREVISPEAISQELIDNSDIKLLFNHKRDQMLARNNRGRGSLKVELREDGVYFDFTTPNTTLGHDVAEMIRREDIVGCSFAFTDRDAQWDFSTREMPLRKVTHITGLYDLSVVADPAYDQTNVSARSIEEAEEASKAEPATEEVPSNEVSPEEKINTLEEDKVPQEENREVDESYKEELEAYKKIIATL